MNTQIITTKPTSCTCCFSGDTLILMADCSTKRIDEIKIGEWIMSENGDTQQVGCDAQNNVDTYFILKTVEEHEITITGDHPVLTEQGWKQVKALVTGDKIKRAYISAQEEEFEEITSIEVKNEDRIMYNLICEDKPIIANGFVCSDFHMQYKMVLIEKYRK